MKKFTIFGILLLAGAILSGQTADDVISRYVDAIGGKKKIGKIKSMLVEGTMEVEGMEGALKIITLNGKGVKSEVDIMGSVVVNCITEQGGWTINPFMGGTSPEDMPEAQYNSEKYQIDIGGPFTNYTEKGFKAELAGEAMVGDIKTMKVILTSPEDNVSEHFFDMESGYLIRSIENGDMGENISTFSDYRELEGMISPFSMEINAAGGQAYIYFTIEKVEMNVPVDESIFERPE